MPGNSRVPAAGFNQNDRRLESLSLALCGVLGLAFAFVLPPLQLTDEHAHFIRAYAISRGEIVAHGTPGLPAPIVAFVMRYPEQAVPFPLLPKQEVLRDLAARAQAPEGGSMALANTDGRHPHLAWGVIGSAAYCPLVYLPATLGIWAARALRLSPPAMMYGARIFNVLTLVAALAVSFRLAPGYRAVMSAVALLPMTLHQAGGISGDVVTIAISFVGLSLALHAREHAVGRRFLILTAAVFTMWGLCKFSVWALPLVLLIPASQFRNRRAWLAYIGGVAVCMACAVAIWGAVDSGNAEAFRLARLSNGIDISANVRLATTYPLTFAQQLLGLIRSSYWAELGQFLGTFSWIMFTLPLWARLEYLALIMVVAATEFSAKPFRVWERAVLLLAFLGGVLLVHAILFVSDGTLCAGGVRMCFAASAGVQGRYFIPFCLCGFLALRQSRVQVRSSTLLGIVLAAGTLQALGALYMIRLAFYP